MSTTMEEKPVSGSSQINPLGHLTRQQLKELEQKEKTRGQKILDLVIMLLPVICGFIAVIEYWEVPNGSPNSHPYTYVWAVAAFMTAYALYALAAGIKYRKGDRRTAEDLRYRAPLFSAFFLLLTFYDYLTLKTGILSQPFVPCMNSILNIAWEDRAYLLECTLHTLRLLFLGYFIGIALGLVTGITCGYSEKARYWINPVIKFLGPFPPQPGFPLSWLWQPPCSGEPCYHCLGSWFAVTVASMSGIQNVDKDFFEAARTLGASEGQLVFRVAIPHAMPSILQGCTQAMSSSCVAIMIAEMMGGKGRAWMVYELG